MVNLKIEEFRKKIVEDINTSGLPIGVIRLVLFEAFKESDNAYRQALTEEKLLAEKENKKGENDHGEEA